jgi:hypothetical protein
MNHHPDYPTPEEREASDAAREDAADALRERHHEERDEIRGRLDAQLPVEQVAVRGEVAQRLGAVALAQERVDELERLAWEAQRAMSDYLAALTAYEQHRNENAGRRADAAIEAGETPF